MIIEEIEAKSLVRVGRPSMFSWAEAHLNPYQGCYHDCKYCDGKSEGYHMHEDFSSRIKVKKNAPELLEQFLKKKGFIPINREKTSTLIDFFPDLKETAKKGLPGKFILFVGGGVCDVYQPAEEEVKLTRKLLKIAYDYNFPVYVLTKNKLALRDLDLLKKINEKTYAAVCYTITLAEEEKQKIFEPNASTTQERFQAIKKLREEGIHSGVYCYPCLPFIGDTKENMEEIYKTAKESGAEFVTAWGLTLKPGRNKQEFMRTIQEYFPDIYPKYELLYGNNNKYGQLDSDIFRKFGLVWPEIRGFKIGYENNMGYCADRYIPEGRITTNLVIAHILLRIAHIKGAILGHPWQQIKELNEASQFVETFDKDLSKLKIEDLQRLPLSDRILPIVLEYTKRNESSYLTKLETKAYNSIGNKLH